jgi:hypothetical protein
MIDGKSINALLYPASPGCRRKTDTAKFERASSSDGDGRSNANIDSGGAIAGRRFNFGILQMSRK